VPRSLPLLRVGACLGLGVWGLFSYPGGSTGTEWVVAWDGDRGGDREGWLGKQVKVLEAPSPDHPNQRGHLELQTILKVQPW
jgi:hypothetical protein